VLKATPFMLMRTFSFACGVLLAFGATGSSARELRSARMAPASVQNPPPPAAQNPPPPANGAPTLQVEPSTVQAGTSTDITLTGSGVRNLLPKISDLSKVDVYTSPVTGGGTKVGTITVGRPSKLGEANQIRLSVTVSPDAAAGPYELYENGNATDAKFQVTAENPAQQTPVPNPSASQTPINVEPSTSPPGQVVNVKLTGSDIANRLKSTTQDKLHLFWQLPGGHTDFSVMLQVTGTEFSAADSSETIQISIAPDALPGTYQLYQDSNATGASATRTPLGARFVVGSSALGEYKICPLTVFQGNETDLLCSQSLLTYREGREVFGKSVAEQYIVVEVKVQNRNDQYQFLLSDIRIGTSNSQLTTSRDRTFVRAYAEKGEAYSARAIGLRVFGAATAILGGIGPAVGNEMLSTAVQIIAGPTTSAVNGLFPDRSSNEINIISDSGFSVVQALVIPTRSPTRVFCFVPQRAILNQPQIKIWNSRSKGAAAADFQTLQKSLLVEISGMHVTQVKTAPVIAKTSVSSGAEKTPVTITGTNFGATQGTSTVTFNKTPATPTTWSDTTIVVPVPAGASTGDIIVTVGGLASNGVTFTVGTPPAIAKTSVSSGAEKTPVTITGTNFGATQGTSTVTFNKTPGTPTSWSDTTIMVPVPAGASTGDIIVTVGGLASNGVAFTVGTLPVITKTSVSSGAEKTPVTITGTNFGAAQGTSKVTFNKTPATPTTWSDTTIVVPVPTGAKTGKILVTVGGLASNGVTFTVGTPPVITKTSVSSGAEKTPVTITGTNFGSTQGTSTVTFNKTPATPTTWSDTTIVVPVPHGASTGNIVVNVRGLRSNGIKFAVP
jgi:hypothetical protein